MSRTYNPVREIVRLTGPRWTNPIKPPPFGHALVLEPAAGPPILVRPGEPVPRPRIGNYSRYYVVDMCAYRLGFEVRLPSSDPSFSFDTSVNFTCAVLDPVQVATRGVHDLAEQVRLSTIRDLRQTAGRFDILHLHAAEAELNDLLDGYHAGPMIEVGSFTVQLGTGEEIHEQVRKHRLSRLAHEHMVGIVDGGPRSIAAAELHTAGGDPTSYLDRLERADQREKQHALDVLGALGGGSEPTFTKSERMRLLERSFGLPSSGEEPRRLARRPRLTSAIATSADGDTPAAEHGQNGTQRPSRVRFSGEDGSGDRKSVV